MRPLSAALLPMLCVLSEAHASTLVVNGGSVVPAESAIIRTDTANNNFGGDGALIVGTTTAPAVLRSVLSFSLAEIPAGSTINSITLSVRQSGPDSGTSTTGVFTIELHQLTGTFSEGTATGAVGGANDGNVSWNFRGPSSAAWTTPGGGGDFSSTILSTISVNPEASAATVQTFVTGLDFVSAAQESIGGTISLIMKATTESTAVRGVAFFNSDEAGDAAQTPTLTIDYTVPEPATATLTAFGVLALLRRKRR